MAFRPELKPYQVITDGDMSKTIIGLVTIIQKLSLISYSWSWSGSSPVGTMAFQVSNDYSIGPTGQVVNAGNWSSVSFTNHGSISPVNSVTVSGNAGTDNGLLTLMGFYAIRPLYTSVSGSGTLQVWICGKVS